MDNEQAEFIEACRAYVGVPFRHQGRDRRGLDCLGLLVCAARDIGLDIHDNLNYARNPDHDEMKAGLLNHCAFVPYTHPGDILWMWWYRRAYPTHLAVITDIHTVIHADGQGCKKVTEHTFPKDWRPRIIHRLRWQGWCKNG